MNFDRAIVRFPDGRVKELNQIEFYAIPLGERIELLTSGRIRFERDHKQISPLDALKKQ